MLHLLVFLLSLCQLNTVTFSESVDTSSLPVNPLTADDFESDLVPEFPPDATDYPIIKTDGDETEIDFEEPMSSVSVDYMNNAIILQFKKQRDDQQQTGMSKNLMRFGRASNKNPMRFGKRQVESMPDPMAMDAFRPGSRFERSNGVEGIRDSRGDNFMRFGRSVDGSSKNLMRFGRSPSDFMRFGRSPSDFMRFGRSPSDFMRFGRSPSNFMRFGRSPSDFMRFGRSPSDFMRFGRAPSDFMRFGRAPSDFMRFGRAPSDFMRFGRSGQNLMRFGRGSGMMRLGRADKNFMRFGKSDGRSDIDKNFMRFGRPDSFMRFGRAPSTDANTNFMRFGKRQKEDTHSSSRSTTEQSHTSKAAKPSTQTEASTVSPYQELDNDLDSLDMMFLNDLNEPLAADDN